MNTSVSQVKHLNVDEKRLFYQSKYDYYKIFNKGVLFVSVISYIVFFISDCMLYGRFAYETFIPRFVALIPYAIFVYMYKRITDYRIMVTASYLLVHIIIWLTDISTYFLEDRSYVIEGMLIMNLIFVCAGLCAPFKYSLVAHCSFIVDILIADVFLDYDNLPMMLMFNIPCVAAVLIIHIKMQKVYLDHYLLTKKLQKLVVHDQLTGMFNRNMLDELSNPDTEELNIPKETAVTVLIVDIDFFKKVNDKYGHEGGDIVLKHTAKVIKESVRSTDYVIRWGGEEFVIILVGCKLDRGSDIAEKIRQNVESSDNLICSVTISIGVAAYDGQNYHDTIEKADVALYTAKKEGRNRVIIYNEGN